MKTLIELLQQFAESQKISKETQAMMSELWSKLPAEDKTDELKFHVDEALAFNASEEESEDATEETTEEESSEETSEDEETTEEDATEEEVKASEVPAELNVQMNED